MSAESGVSGEVLRGRRGNLLSSGKSDYRKLAYRPKSASLPADHSLVDEFAGPLPVGLQLAQHVVDEFGNLVLIESISYAVFCLKKKKDNLSNGTPLAGTTWPQGTRSARDGLCRERQW